MSTGETYGVPEPHDLNTLERRVWPAYPAGAAARSFGSLLRRRLNVDQPSRVSPTKKPAGAGLRSCRILARAQPTPPAVNFPLWKN
jgi:hypothetical protein